jgi:formylglycine-generating enzyme required for sulfatase activity
MRTGVLLGLLTVGVVTKALVLPAGAQERPDMAIGSEVTTNSVGMKLRLIPAGSFRMGSEKGSDVPVHQVTITKPFYIGVTEVTQEQWEKVVGVNPSRTRGAGLPVEAVSWYDARSFCRLLSDKEKEKYRLPTEAEWEYACRAGTVTEYYWGEEYDGRYACCNADSDYRSQPVASRLPNQWGLHDMSGNLWEWCEDWFAPFPRGDQVDPRGPTGGEYKVLRGGSYMMVMEACRSAHRYALKQDERAEGTGLGFRVVRVRE